MIKRFFILIIPVIIVSCYSIEKRPTDIIKPDKMKDILWDVMRAQTLAQETSLKDSGISMPLEIKLLSKKIFKMHNTDSSHFVESYNWYVKHPEALKVIFDSLYNQKQRESEKELKRKEKLLQHPM
jgi:hypothetical protein